MIRIAPLCLGSLAGILAAAAGACAPTPIADRDAVVPGVSLELASVRRATIDDVSYDVALSIPEDRTAAVQGSLTARFRLASNEMPLVFDFAQSPDHVVRVLVGGNEIDALVGGEHIVVPAAALQVGGNEVTIEFVAGDGSLNRNDEFLYTLFVPDRARVAIPVFDQPDLKARIAWRLETPADWQAVANGALVAREVSEQRAHFQFAATAPISSYVFAFAAGRFDVVEGERDGRTMRMLHRETDAESLARNVEEIFDLHAAALAWLEDYTGIEYPFDKFDFVAVPAFQYGGMEHPGAIFYRSRGLFLDAAATQNQVLGRASLIAHETAHMWFGNLVTMQWFDDVWMKEVFANFMAAKIVNPGFPEVDHDLRFLLAHYPAAYGVDRTPGANAIRQELGNLNEAGSLYGAIIYQKAPIVMKHLELLMGEEPFRDGLREYLSNHRYGNATWPDLVAVMDARTDEDLRLWSEVWVNEARRPRVALAAFEVGDSGIDSIVIQQVDPAGRGRVWNQRLQVRLGYADRDDVVVPVDVREELTEVPGVAGLPEPDFVLLNGAGVGYGNFVLDARSLEYLLEHLYDIDAAQVRAVAWLGVQDAMLDGAATPARVLRLAMMGVDRETDQLNLQRVLGTLSGTFWDYLSADQRASLSRDVETLLWLGLERQDSARTKAAFFAAFRDVATTDSALDRLRSIGSGDEVVEQLPLSESDFTAIAQQLALRGVADAEALLDAQAARLDNPDRRAQFDFVRPALSADQDTRDAFFESLLLASNREREPWVLEGLRFLHHPLRAAHSEKYIRPSLEAIDEIQRTGDIFFPLGWLSATLSGHSSVTAVAIVQGFLAERPDLPEKLRGKVQQAADGLERAARITDGG